MLTLKDVLDQKPDLDAGIMMCFHPAAQMKIFMYFDLPGVYLTVKGKTVPDKLAKQAGFDTTYWGNIKRKRELMVEAGVAVERELAFRESKEAVVVKELNGFKLVDIGMDRYVIKSADDELYMDKQFTRSEGEMYLQIVAKPDEAEEAPAPLAKKPGLRSAADL